MEESKKRSKRRRVQKLADKLFGEVPSKVLVTETAPLQVAEDVPIQLNVSQDLGNIYEQSEFGSI